MVALVTVSPYTPPMIGVRIDGDEIWLEPEEWERWVQDGRIPPQAMVLVGDGEWVEARTLITEPTSGRMTTAPPGPGIRDILFPRRGLSATEALILANLVVALVLFFVLSGELYLTRVRAWTDGWWHAVRDDHAYWWWVPTIFMHAGPGHLFGNMISLLATAGAVEFLMGRRWSYTVYVLTGLAGMALSYFGHDRPPLSIGASGAVFGLAGCTLAFVIRRYRSFTYRQRWKARRVYVPLFVLLFLPSLLHADYLGHTGGLVTGLLLGTLIPPHRRILELTSAPDPIAETD